MLLRCALMQFSAVLLVHFTEVRQTSGSENINITEFSSVLSHSPNEDYLNSTIFSATTEVDYTGTKFWKTATPETISVVTQPSPSIADATTNAPTDAPTNATTDAPTDATTNATIDAPTDAPTNATTDAPTDATTNATTDAPTDAPTDATTDTPTDATTNATTDAPTDATTNAPTDASTDATSVPAATDRASGAAYGCPCNITPWLCDIGCCCDVIDCNIENLTTVFNGCDTQESYASCIESWLMFRANIDPALITVNESFFCVKSQEDNQAQQNSPAEFQLPKLQDFYSFTAQALQSSNPTNRAFYMVDDVILTYYNSSRLLGVFKQPSAGANTASCVDRNPARFLRSLSFSCSRSVTLETCRTDPSLSASSYFSDMNLLKVPIPQNVSLPGFRIPIFALSEWPLPDIQNGTCLNIVSKVQYVLEYTSGGTITKVTVNMSLTNSDVGQQLLQHHAVSYQLAQPSSTPVPMVAVGLNPGATLIGLFSEELQPLTVQRISQGGECSSSLQTRASILFPSNYISGCAYSSSLRNCSELRSQLYGILRGVSVPDLVAMNAGPKPDWTRVITQDCFTTPPEDSCESGCLVPVTLSIQLLWAQRGLLSLPQNQILGAKYLFRCQTVRCPISSPLAVMTEVTFADATVYPEAPRGRPQPQWKFPFGFFSRGADEQDYEPVLNHCDSRDGLCVCILWLIAFTLSVILQ